MDTQEFVKQYREEFGQNAALPLMFYYSDTRLAETEKIQGCFLKYLRLAMDGKLRLEDPSAERINVPAVPRYYWRYRMHLTLENLLGQREFNDSIKEMTASSGR